MLTTKIIITLLFVLVFPFIKEAPSEPMVEETIDHFYQ